MANIGVKIELEGAPQYKENMANLTAQTKLYQAQVKSLASQMGSSMSAFQKSITTSKALEQQLEALKNKSALLEQQIEKNTEKYGADSTNVIRLKTQYQNLQAEIANTEAELKKLGGTWGAVGAQFEAIGSKLTSIGNKMTSVGDTLTKKVSVPLAGLGAASVKSFADWESAFAGVMKTVDETATTTYEDLAEGIKQMSTETAASKEEIAGVAEAAGQLGVGADDILKFTKTMVMMGDSTNLSAEEAATALARISNITGEPLENIDKLGASIVALGNSFATNESSIVEMSNRLASAGTIAGLSTTDVLALAAAMSSVGIEAEAGGTAMTQTLTSISQAVSAGGDDLNRLAQVSGKTAQEFAAEWKASPVTALQEFISGLSEMNAAGVDTYAILDELGMSGIRQSNMLQSLALASDQLTSAINVSNQAYIENAALTDEAEKRYQTFNSQLSQTKEMASNVAIQFGEIMMPYVQKLVEKIQSLVQWFGNLDGKTQEMIVKIGLIIAAIGPALSIVGTIISTIGSILTAVGAVIKLGPTILAMITSIQTVITGTLIPAIAGIITAVAPFLPLIAAVAAAIAAIIIVIKNWAEITEFVKEKWKILTNFLAETIAKIQRFFEEHFGFLGMLFSTKIEVIKTIITTAVNIIKILLQTTGQIIRALIDGDWSKIGQIVSTAWANIQKAINDGVLNVIKAVTDMGVNAKQKFDELLNNAKEWGSHFVQNFCDGITQKMSALIDKVRSMAETVRSYLHFSTGPDVGPLKDFNRWPKHMMDNYARGIESARYIVKDAVADVAADVSLLASPFDTAAMYDAVRSGASDADISLSIGDREFTRALRDMGVIFNG